MSDIKDDTTIKNAGKKAKKIIKRVMIWFFVIILVCIGILAVFTWLHKKSDKVQNAKEPEEYFYELESQNENITYAEDSGIIYMNNEIIIMVSADVDLQQIQTVVENFDGTIIDAMEDIGVYKVRLNKEYSLKQMNRLIEKLKEYSEIEDAFINPVITMEEDEAAVEEDEAAVEEKEPVYPADPWANASWDTEVPDGANWGMEAVRAPQAWGYFSELDTVKVGLIDTMINTDHEDLEGTCYITFTDIDDGQSSTLQVTPNDVKAQDHGTHVAGIMAATWNDKGVSGVLADKADLYYSAAYYTPNNSTGSGYYDAYNYVKAISALIDKGVQSINISQNTSRLIGFAASHGNENAISHLEVQANLAEAMLLRIINGIEERGDKDFVICVSAGNSNNTTYYKNKNAEFGYKESYIWPWEAFNGEKGGSDAQYNNFLSFIDDEKVKGRIIVVGSAGIDNKKSNDEETRYKYSKFSNIGERVDIIAPGEKIYSCVVKSYAYLNGTSMSAPFVTAAAGMVYAANPELSGPEVKKIVCASTYGRLYYENGSSGMLDLSAAVKYSLETRDHSVNSVIKETTNDGIDLCFLVDTTSSMGDDIENTKVNMEEILLSLSEKCGDYRVALVDYRDFPERTYDSDDYPAKIQLGFSNDNDAILNAIKALTLGYGGDNKETVYSGIEQALSLDWRANAKKVIIVLGDAPPLDPEPYTDYTYDAILAALYDAKITIDTEQSDDRVISDSKASMINVYTIGTEANADAIDFFEAISEDTGGAYTDVSSAAEVSNAIIDSIDMIEIASLLDISSDFGDEFSGETVELYQDGAFFFEFDLDDEGCFVLEDMEADTYEWTIPRLAVSGKLKVKEDSEKSRIVFEREWYSFALVLWQRHKALLIAGVAGCILVITLLWIMIHKIKNMLRNSKKKKDALNSAEYSSNAQETQEQSTNAQGPNAQAQYVQEENVQAQTVAFCPMCGTAVVPDSNFCMNCGNKLQ